MLSTILQAYGLSPEHCVTTAFGSGLINHTWRVDCGEQSFVLQRINDNVFKTPFAISNNMQRIGSYLSQKHPEYLFVHPVNTTAGEAMVYDEQQGYFRLTPFVAGSHTIDVVASPDQAFEAATQFARFTKLLKEFDADKLAVTLPDFHNLSLRYSQFCEALKNANPERLQKSHELIYFLKGNKTIVEQYEALLNNDGFKKRVTHHDTKISNVLFDDSDKGLCVIDLDTTMPGYFISDVGDMLRTYLSPVSEEEKDFSKIQIREDYFTAIAEGYLGEMCTELSEQEKAHFVYAGKFMIYMQALRFLTDYLNNDVYYGQKYEGHNLLRAGNQVTLLKRLMEKEETLQTIVQKMTVVHDQPTTKPVAY